LKRNLLSLYHSCGTPSKAVVKPIEDDAGKGKRSKRKLCCNGTNSGSKFAALEREQTSV